MSRSNSAPVPQRAAEPGAIASALLLIVKVIGWLILGLVFSIGVEWLGLIFWWPDQGLGHSRRMLAAELEYLGAHDQPGLITADPNAFGRSFADAFYHVTFEVTGLVTGIQRLNADPTASDSFLLKLSRTVYQPVATFAISAITITHVYAVRLAVLVLATPVFVLTGLVGLTDGLVVRDRRRFGGARETSFVYHHAKRIVLPSVAGAWVIYLACPVSVHPNLIVLPSAVLFGLALGVSAATFKKHL
jgi:integrating conjugative element membrane protein (TIGR03747 family)